MGYWEQVGVANKQEPPSFRRRILDTLGVVGLIAAMAGLPIVIAWLVGR